MTIDVQTAPASTEAEWNEPDGIGPRGTVILIAGRGETGPTYRRFGSRIAADAYRVRVIENTPDAAAVRDRVREVLADPTLPEPRVLAGSDAGAALALELAAEGAPIAAVIIAGLPTSQPEQTGEWTDELEARTACPNHQGVLTRTAEHGAIWQPLPADLLGVVASGIRVPVLAVHGEADVLSPVGDALEVYRGIPRHEIAVVAGGRHDILNDVTHRSVAATVVLFLERLRLDADLTAIVTTP
jgi:alpha-beta hydrolase superfamily lysophospholipase